MINFKCRIKNIYYTFDHQINQTVLKELYKVTGGDLSEDAVSVKEFGAFKNLCCFDHAISETADMIQAVLDAVGADDKQTIFIQELDKSNHTIYFEVFTLRHLGDNDYLQLKCSIEKQSINKKGHVRNIDITDSEIGPYIKIGFFDPRKKDLIKAV